MDQHELNLCALAMARHQSAYHIFQSAAQIWEFTSKKIDTDFFCYLNEGFIPVYVKRYCVEELRGCPDVIQRYLWHYKTSLY